MRKKRERGVGKKGKKEKKRRRGGKKGNEEVNDRVA